MPRPDFTGAVEDSPANGSITTQIVGAPPKPPASPNVVARPVSIFDIWPDPRQPRRILPSDVQLYWPQVKPGDNLSLLFDIWLEATYVEMTGDTGNSSNVEWLEARVAGNWQEDWEYSDNPGVCESSLLLVADLAGSIRREGLNNPITITTHGQRFQIETGERRWLAYHLLHFLYPDEGWQKMPARLVETSNVWRQAAENGQRQNLNAIGRARQYAILLMDLCPDAALRDYEECASDRAYYAQALDLRIPRGKRDQILQAMGVAGVASLDRFKTTLEIGDDLWVLADDTNMSERQIEEKFRTRNNSEKPSEKKLKTMYDTLMDKGAKLETKAERRSYLEQLEQALDALRRSWDM